MLKLHGANPSNASSNFETLDQLIKFAAKEFGNKEAWFFELSGQSITFSEIGDLVPKVARSLSSKGVHADKPVGVITENTLEFPISWLALAWLGVPMVPINNRYGTTDAGHLLKEASLTQVIGSEKYEEFINSIDGPLDITFIKAEKLVADGKDSSMIEPAANADSLANIQFTSGTTGKPKGCMLGHDYWLQIAHALTSEFPRISASDTMLTAQPFHYIDPQWNIVTSLLSGAKLVILDGFHPSTFWERVRHHQVTYFYCLGMMPNLLLQMPEHKDDKNHSVRAIEASAISKSIHADLNSRWSVGWFEAFGMTETGADIFVDEAEGPEVVGTGCIGRPRNHRQVKIVDDKGMSLGPNQVGRLMLKGPGMARGYFNDPKSTSEAFVGGWFDTGDLASIDSKGRLYHRGRTKDMIRRSGENIAAVEVESVLNQHPLVKLSGLIPVADAIREEEAFAILTSSQEIEDEPLFFEQLIDFCQSKLAPFKIPRYWKLVENLPLTDSERVSKKDLRREEFTNRVWDSKTSQIVDRVEV
ncbi:MAG TPA: AMP-binding protein [Microbacteriaceae bacterium]